MTDLIDRNALADEIRSLQVTVTGLRAGKGVLAAYAKEYRDAVLQIVDDQAAVDTELVTAHWEDDPGGEYSYLCSNCGGDSIDVYDYCPYCGARMFAEVQG